MKITINKKQKLVFAAILVPVALLLTSIGVLQYHDELPDPDPQAELASFQVAEGFEVTLFAADPMVVKPIQMNWDAQGRLWVVTSTAYPHMKSGEEANDKIYILEDTDGDGKADKSTIFAEGLQTPTGILPGDGGVYVANSTELLHLADTDGDGKADKKRQVLSGFGTADTHHLIHTFRWGPEGDLYFNQSIYIYSHVETPYGVRRLEGGGVWQLDPQTLELDVYAKGLVNPWGLQFNRWGQSFLTDGAGGEGINYAFPGATFLTSPGAERIIRGLNPGQPKHCGLDFVSGRHLPEDWAGSLITNDFRANRINRFKLEELGSGFVSKQAEDLLWTDNIAFRPVDISVGPDGAIYVADWYNPIIQHGEVDFYDPRRDQQHGRIWRITAKNRPLVKRQNLETAGVRELLEALKEPEDWTRSQARLVLKSRGAADVIPALQEWMANLDSQHANYEHQLLEALWVHQSLNAVHEPLLLSLLNAKQHGARAAAIRVLQAWRDKITNTPGLLAKAVADEHPLVRLEAIIALRKLKTAEAARTALAALDRPMDDYLDYSLWYTMRELEPQWVEQVKKEPGFFGDSRKTAFALKSVHHPEAISQLVQLYQQNQIPQEYEKDVLSSIGKWGTASDLGVLLDMSVKNPQDNHTAAHLAALEEAARQRNVQPSGDLSRIIPFIKSSDEATAVSAIRLVGYWKMENMIPQLTELARSGRKNIKKAALGGLSSIDKARAETLLTEMSGAKNPPELRQLAVAQLASLNVNEAARIGVDLLRSLPAKESPDDLFQAFISGKEGIAALSRELGSRKIPEGMAKTGRLLVQRQVPWHRQNDDDVKLLKEALEASGGTLPVERMPQQLNAQEIHALAGQIRAAADPEKGEAVFRKTGCTPCHAIGGAGGLIGPDLSSLGTSSPVETIIKSILYPTESIKEGYELQRVVKTDGDGMMGYLVSTGASEVVIRDMTGEEVSIPKSQVELIERIPGSLMAPGLTAGLNRDEFINLVGFLSKLGEQGKFRVPTNRFVRKWEAVTASTELAGKLRQKGLPYILEQDDDISLMPLYSKVSGELPLEEVAVLETGPGKRYSFIRFKLEVLSKGNVKLQMNTTAGINGWVGREPVQPTANGIELNLEPGVHQFTLAVDRQVQKGGSLSIQLQDAASNPAQTRLVMGK